MSSPTLQDYADDVHRAYQAAFIPLQRPPRVAELPGRPSIGLSGWTWSDMLVRLCLEDALRAWWQRHVDSTLEVPKSRWRLVEGTSDDRTIALYDKLRDNGVRLVGEDPTYPEEYGWLHFVPELEPDVRALLFRAPRSKARGLEQLIHDKLGSIGSRHP